jgi:hypothetical protein
MTNTLTITGTDANAVRLAIAFIRDFWQGPESGDFSGIIIQNKNTAAAMLSTSQLASGADLADVTKLTDVQYTALQSNGTPSPAVIAWINDKIIRDMRGHILTLERDRALNAATINSWTMSG